MLITFKEVKDGLNLRKKNISLHFVNYMIATNMYYLTDCPSF